jgi:hypothetical protein
MLVENTIGIMIFYISREFIHKYMIACKGTMSKSHPREYRINLIEDIERIINIKVRAMYLAQALSR